MKNNVWIFYALLTVVYIVGVVGLSTQSTHALFVSLSALNLLIANAILFWFHQPRTLRFFQKGIAIMVAGFLIEVVGVKTGLVFGDYTYGDSLGLKLLDVPLIIGLNWFFMVYCAAQIASLYRLSLIPTAILAGGFMVVYDLVLEPNAIALNYWTWQGILVPLQNYLAWFVLGTLFSLFFLYKNKWIPNLLAIFLYWLQIIFFLALMMLR